MTGLYVLFEGVDGSGKSTLAKRLALTIPGSKYLMEPYHFDLHLIAKDIGVTPDAKAMVYEADRLSLAETTRNLLGLDVTVLQDRSFYSTLAYQNPSRGVRLFLLRPRAVEPDLIVWLDAPAEALRSRLEARGELSEYEVDVEYQEEVRGRYRALLEGHPKVLKLDALADEDANHEAVMSHLASLTGQQRATRVNFGA